MAAFLQDKERFCVSPPTKSKTTSTFSLRIPAKPNAYSEGNRTAFRDEPEHPSERSDAGISIVQEVFGFVKKNLSGAQRRNRAASGERGVGKGAAALVPTSARSNQDRDERSARSTNFER
jgi:hypothetical protein